MLKFSGISLVTKHAIKIIFIHELSTALDISDVSHSYIKLTKHNTKS